MIWFYLFSYLKPFHFLSCFLIYYSVVYYRFRLYFSLSFYFSFTFSCHILFCFHEFVSIMFINLILSVLFFFYYFFLLFNLFYFFLLFLHYNSLLSIDICIVNFFSCLFYLSDVSAKYRSFSHCFSLIFTFLFIPLSFSFSS